MCTVGPQLVQVTFVSSGTGPNSVPGVKAGDMLIAAYDQTVNNTNGLNNTAFTQYVSTDDYMTGQSAVSGDTYIVILVRPGS
jgi:hypothetical protein